MGVLRYLFDLPETIVSKLYTLEKSYVFLLRIFQRIGQIHNTITVDTTRATFVEQYRHTYGVITMWPRKYKESEILMYLFFQRSCYLPTWSLCITLPILWYKCQILMYVSPGAGKWLALRFCDVLTYFCVSRIPNEEYVKEQREKIEKRPVPTRVDYNILERNNDWYYNRNNYSYWDEYPRERSVMVSQRQDTLRSSTNAVRHTHRSSEGQSGATQSTFLPRATVTVPQATRPAPLRSTATVPQATRPAPLGSTVTVPQATRPAPLRSTVTVPQTPTFPDPTSRVTRIPSLFGLNRHPNSWLGRELVTYRAVDASSDPFRSITAMFPPRMVVVRIFQVVNPLLETSFKLKQHFAYADEPPMRLFHGTAKNKVHDICAYNFNWRLYGTSRGHQCGQGVCFTPSPKFAMNFCYDWPTKVIILADVLVRRTCIGNSDMGVPPYGVDTAIRRDRKTFVKFSDAEFNPLYVIYFDTTNAW